MFHTLIVARTIVILGILNFLALSSGFFVHSDVLFGVWALYLVMKLVQYQYPQTAIYVFARSKGERDFIL